MVKDEQKHVCMEMTAVVLHEGALAHYDVTLGEDGNCYAYLQQYKGRSENAPPRKINLHKEGRHWVSNETHSNLPDELGYAIEMKAKPLLDARKRGGGHPAG